ncbi:MAG: glycosyltransferase [Planctomycetota bacterium]
MTPRTRVLLLSPAPPGGSAREQGGVAGYVSDLAIALRDHGHAVAVAASGHGFTPSHLVSRLGRRVGRCRMQQLEPIEGIDRFEIINAPLLAPSLWQFDDPAAEIRCRPVERALGQVVGKWNPDVVHIHGFEGFGAGIVRALRRRAVRVVVSLHNHHPYCPQVFLMRGRRIACTDFDGGRACETCETGIDIGRERERRAGLRPTDPVPVLPVPPMPPTVGLDEDGLPDAAAHQILAASPATWRPVEDADFLPTRHEPASTPFARRRMAYIAALNHADAVLAVSAAVAELAAAMGVDTKRTRVVPIGSWAAGRGPVRLGHWPLGPEDPLQLVFLGFNTYPKGLAMLIDAIALLPVNLRQRTHLAAFGPGCRAMEPRLAELSPWLGGWELGGGYDRQSLAGLLEGRHAGVVPSVWLDNGPQTAIELRAFGVPVIGARIGGVPDIVQDGADGWLFRANDRADLARTIALLFEDQRRWTSVQKQSRPWIPMAEHAARLSELYRSVL